MALDESWTVEECNRNDIKDFIELHHYSRSINGVMSKYCFRLMHNGKMVGAMLFGSTAMANAWKRYVDSPDKLIELRRLVLIDDTPKNSESFFIGRALKWLRDNTEIERVVSYADPNYGHAGVIYKATNFSHVGMTARGKVIMWNGKKYHDKAIRAKYNGRLKPFAQRVKDALESGEAVYVEQKPKHIYLYTFKRKRGSRTNEE